MDNYEQGTSQKIPKQIESSRKYSNIHLWQ